MVIEFLGIPGCGKSYLASQLSEHSNRRIVDLTEISRESLFPKIYFKLVRFFIKISPTYNLEKKDFVRILEDYKNQKAQYNEIFIINYIEQIVLYKYFYNRYSKSKKIYLLDEGLYQQFVNMMINYNVSIEKIDTILNKFGYIPNAFFIRCKVETAIESIKERNRHVCYIDELVGNDRLNFLSGYDYCCEMLYEKYDITALDRGNKSNWSIILEKIKEE